MLAQTAIPFLKENSERKIIEIASDDEINAKIKSHE
jgi:hypothetical protein